MSEFLSLAIESADGGTVVRVSGEMDLDTIPEVRGCLASLAGDVIIDLSEVSFIDSQGINVLVSEQRRRTKDGDRLVIRGASPVALRTFELTGVDRFLNLEGVDEV